MSWDQLVDIRREAIEDRAATRDQAPTSCPRDGELLETGPAGELFCRFDGYQWPRDRTTYGD